MNDFHRALIHELKHINSHLGWLCAITDSFVKYYTGEWKDIDVELINNRGKGENDEQGA